jgi:hypothetical protein
MRPQQRNVAAAIVQRDHLTVDAGFERARAPARPNVLAHQRVLRIHRHVADVLGLGVTRHLEHERVVGVQHGAIGRDLDHDPFDFRELLQRVDALEAEVIGLHVQHCTDVHLAHAHAGAQQAAARGFQHGHVDLRICQHHLCGHRTSHVALHSALSVDVHAVGRRQARRVAAHLRDVREHARRRRLAVRTRDRGDRDSRRRAGREQHVDHRRGDVARRSLAGRHVHAESGCRVDLADTAADRAVALGDIGRQEIDTADVEADRANRAHRHVAVVGMNDVRHVGRCATGGEIRRGAQIHDAAALRD